MNNLIPNYKYLTEETKTRVYKSTMRPVISYISEAKTDTATATAQRNNKG